MGQDGGRAAEGHIEAGAEQLALGGHQVGEAVEDEVEIGFAGNGDVERLAGGCGGLKIHAVNPYCFVAYG